MAARAGQGAEVHVVSMVVDVRKITVAMGSLEEGLDLDY